MANSDLKARFGIVVRAWRNRLGISQEELAGRAGLHRTYITDIERGARNVSLESIEKLAMALEIPVATLFAEAEDRTADTGVSGTTPPPNDLVDILMVEDDAHDVELTLRAFQNANITNRIHVASDGVEALDFLFCTGKYAGRQAGRLPHVILLDLKLPKLEGLEVLRRIKSDSRTAKIPVAVLTSSQHDRDVAESRRLGAEAYILKPVNLESFSKVTPQLSFHWALLRSGLATSPSHSARSTAHPPL